MPVSTSLSASSLNDHSGARTGLASITSGVTVLLTLLVLAPLFSQLPKPVLGALIIEAVVMGMMNLPEMRRMYRVKRFDFWVAVAAILGTLAFGVLAGRDHRDRLSLLWLVAVATQPDMPILGARAGHPGVPRPRREPRRRAAHRRGRGPARRRAVLRHRRRAGGPGPHTDPGDPDVTGVVLDFEGVNFIDSQGSARLDDILVLCHQAEVTLRLARVKPAVRAALDREGLIARLGSDHIHGNVHRAVEAEKAEAAAVREARRRRSP